MNHPAKDADLRVSREDDAVAEDKSYTLRLCLDSRISIEKIIGTQHETVAPGSS